jgi:hypothetical protein
VKVIRLTSAALSDEDCDGLAGHLLGADAYDTLIEDEADIYKPDGTLLARLRQRVLDPVMCESAFPVWADAAHDTTNRGYAGGIIETQEEADRLAIGRGGIGARFTSPTRVRPIRADGTLSNTEIAKTVQSGIVGFFDRNPRFPYCRLTAYNLAHPRRFASVIPFIQRVDAKFRELVPKRHEAQLRYVQKTSADFTIHGTSFTTVTVNRNFQTAVHKDVGDLKLGFGVMSCLRRGRYNGCYFCFPKYRIALDMKSGCVLCADVHEWHGNTPMKGNKGMFERVSLVFYYRERMRQCGSAMEELKRAKGRRRNERGS